MKKNVTRRMLVLGVLLLAIAAPAMTYSAYALRLPNDEAAGAPVVLPSSAREDDATLRLSEEAAMVMAGMALIGAAAVVRRAA